MTPRNTDRNATKNDTVVTAASTEDILPAEMHIDRMTPARALAAMLDNQAHAITAGVIRSICRSAGNISSVEAASTPASFFVAFLSVFLGVIPPL